MIEVCVSREGVDDDEPPSSAWVENVIAETLRVEGVQDSCEVSVLITGDQRMLELNRDYRGQEKTTDVLSFAFEEGSTVPLPPGLPRVLGDIVLSLETLQRQAQKNGVTQPRETAWALCHGVLHLLGYDHQTDEEDAAMRAREQQVLNSLGQGALSW